MKLILSAAIVIVHLALTPTPSQAQDVVPHIVIEGTESPDGRYAIAWGIPYETMDRKNPQSIDLDRVRNFLVDLATNTQIATLTSTHFASREFTKNRSHLSTCWRKDSRALFVVEGARFGFASVALVYITHPEKAHDQCSDVIPLTQALRRKVKEEMQKDHPDLGESIDQYVVGADPEFPTWSDTVTLKTTAEIPKDSESLFFEKTLAVSLPGPDLLDP